jgi:very-short-patch-repair endonuclease
MLRYENHLKKSARKLRKNMTDSECVLWSRLRGKQLYGVQVYRQKPIGEYIVDFYIARAKLVIEVDGSQHSLNENAEKDRERDAYMNSVGIQVLRFNSIEVLKETDAVVIVIARAVRERLKLSSDPKMSEFSSSI